ncbi:MAG: SIS domain-containing protein, partial [Treponema sp.]|nr:SIS domain-containing protein [Treponema sp.]
GVGASYLTALAGYLMFSRITPKVGIGTDNHTQYATAALLSSGDLAIIVSYSGESGEILEIAKSLKQNGTKIICISRFLKSALTSYSDITLLNGVEKRLFDVYTVPLKISEFFILEILYEEYFRRTKEDSTKNRDIVLKALTKKQY